MMIGRDFNILRHLQEENDNMFSNMWPFLFNVVIDSLDLRKINVSGHQYTWSNNHQNPTFEKLDCVLMSIEWDLKYPLVTVHALERTDVSDHTTFLLDIGELAPPGVANLSSLSWDG